jgi:hypothetical protein
MCTVLPRLSSVHHGGEFQSATSSRNRAHTTTCAHRSMEEFGRHPTLVTTPSYRRQFCFAHPDCVSSCLLVRNSTHEGSRSRAEREHSSSVLRFILMFFCLTQRSSVRLGLKPADSHRKASGAAVRYQPTGMTMVVQARKGERPYLNTSMRCGFFIDAAQTAPASILISHPRTLRRGEKASEMRPPNRASVTLVFLPVATFNTGF